MSIARPFTFTANTYAKASEVNADFDVLYSQVNTNISDIASNSVDIDNLENNKANINGSTSQRFAVADATSNGDAINKQTLFNYLRNSLGFIWGLVITPDSGSPNDTIIVGSGSCYDTGRTVVLALSSSLSKKNNNQAASATYYVYIIGNDTGSSTDILISTSSSTPTLPSGYTKYRRIGYYTTDSSKHINQIHYYGYAANRDNSSYYIYNFREINWGSGVSVTLPTSDSKYTAPYDGVYVTTIYKNNTTAHLVINNNTTSYVYRDAADGATNMSFFVPLTKGDVIYWGASLTAVESKFYRYKA